MTGVFQAATRNLEDYRAPGWAGPLTVPPGVAGAPGPPGAAGMTAGASAASGMVPPCGVLWVHPRSTVAMMSQAARMATTIQASGGIFRAALRSESAGLGR